MFIKIGHRGAMGYEPENTMASFAKAIELNVDMIELDVYVCASGELVVIHDDKVDRTTNGKGYVMQKTLTQLRSLDAGNGEKIPLLTEVMDLVDRKVGVNIELKGIGTAAPVCALIEKYVKEKNWQHDDFVISSFIHQEIKTTKTIQPALATGALICCMPYDYAAFTEALDVAYLNLCGEFINQEFVDDAHRRNLKVLVWTVNDLDEIARIKGYGVDGIFSNFPDRL